MKKTEELVIITKTNETALGCNKRTNGRSSLNNVTGAENESPDSCPSTATTVKTIRPGF